MADVSLIITDPPRPVVEMLIADASGQDKPVSDVAITVLCRAFRVRYERSHKPYVPLSSDRRLIFMGAPPELREKINARAQEKGYTARGVILSELQKYYGLPVDSPRRRPRSVRAA